MSTEPVSTGSPPPGSAPRRAAPPPPPIPVPAAAGPAATTTADPAEGTGGESPDAVVASEPRWYPDSIIAFVLSLLGLTAPIGIFLGTRAISQRSAKEDLSRSFAVVAVVLGWLWVVALILAFILWAWIRPTLW